jgi:tetrahydromethanopterin S-methyltransferase subunit H
MDKIRAKYLGDKDYTRYGLVQAVTFQSHENVSDEEKDMFDDAGAKLLATTIKDF